MKKLILLFLLTTLTACAGTETKTTGTEINEEKINAIKVTVTTREEIINTFGEPQDTREEEGREVLTYKYEKDKTPTYMGGLIVNKKLATKDYTLLTIKIERGLVVSFDYSIVENEKIKKDE